MSKFSPAFYILTTRFRTTNKALRHIHQPQPPTHGHAYTHTFDKRLLLSLEGRFPIVVHQPKGYRRTCLRVGQGMMMLSQIEAAIGRHGI